MLKMDKKKKLNSLYKFENVTKVVFLSKNYTWDRIIYLELSDHNYFYTLYLFLKKY